MRINFGCRALRLAIAGAQSPPAHRKCQMLLYSGLVAPQEGRGSDHVYLFQGTGGLTSAVDLHRRHLPRHDTISSLLCALPPCTLPCQSHYTWLVARIRNALPASSTLPPVMAARPALCSTPSLLSLHRGMVLGQRPAGGGAEQCKHTLSTENTIVMQQRRHRARPWQASRCSLLRHMPDPTQQHAPPVSIARRRVAVKALFCNALQPVLLAAGRAGYCWTRRRV